MDWINFTQRVSCDGDFTEQPSQEQIAKVQECFKTLPSVEQQILNLLYFEKIPVHQISTELNLSIHKIRCMGKNGFRKLQKRVSTP